MCLITEQKKPKVADKDIVCYKAGGYNKQKNIFWGIYYCFEYELSKLYKTKLKESTDCFYYDSEAIEQYGLNPFHFRPGKLMEELKKRYNIIGSGFHSAESLDRLKREGRSEKAKCIIPKGSLYYKDKTGLLVSNQIIVEEIINL